METANVMKKIEETAAASSPSLRNIHRMKVGTFIRQGDVYLERIARLPADAGVAVADRQLAAGTTQGSRHVAEGAGVKVYAAPKKAHALTGPFVVSKERFLLTHPEHGHFSLPGGIYRTTFQRDYARERAAEIRAVAD